MVYNPNRILRDLARSPFQTSFLLCTFFIFVYHAVLYTASLDTVRFYVDSLKVPDNAATKLESNVSRVGTNTKQDYKGIDKGTYVAEPFHFTPEGMPGVVAKWRTEGHVEKLKITDVLSIVGKLLIIHLVELVR